MSKYVPKKQRVNREIAELEGQGRYDEANKLRQVREQERIQRIQTEKEKIFKDKVTTILSQFKRAELKRLQENDNFGNVEMMRGWCTERHTFHQDQIYCTYIHNTIQFKEYLTPHCMDSYGLPCYYGADCWFNHMPTKEQVEVAVRSDDTITTYDTYIAHLQKESDDDHLSSNIVADNAPPRDHWVPTEADVIDRWPDLPQRALLSTGSGGLISSLIAQASPISSNTAITNVALTPSYSAWADTDTRGWATGKRSFGIQNSDVDRLFPKEAAKKTDATLAAGQLSANSSSSLLNRPVPCIGRPAIVNSQKPTTLPQPPVSSAATLDAVPATILTTSLKISMKKFKLATSLSITPPPLVSHSSQTTAAATPTVAPPKKKCRASASIRAIRATPTVPAAAARAASRVPAPPRSKLFRRLKGAVTDQPTQPAQSSRTALIPHPPFPYPRTTTTTTTSAPAFHTVPARSTGLVTGVQPIPSPASVPAIPLLLMRAALVPDLNEGDEGEDDEGYSECDGYNSDLDSNRSGEYINHDRIMQEHNFYPEYSYQYCN